MVNVYEVHRSSNGYQYEVDKEVRKAHEQRRARLAHNNCNLTSSAVGGSCPGEGGSLGGIEDLDLVQGLTIVEG